MVDSSDVTVGDLRPDQLALLATFGRRRRVAVGDVLFADGDETYNFYVVMSGAVDIVGHFDGEDDVIVQHGPGRFVGELNLLTGQRVYLTARVAKAGEVIEIEPDAFRRLIATVPGVSDTILATLVLRRSLLLEARRALGARRSGRATRPSRSRCASSSPRNRIPHQWLDVDTDPEVDRLVGRVRPRRRRPPSRRQPADRCCAARLRARSRRSSG